MRIELFAMDCIERAHNNCKHAAKTSSALPNVVAGMKVTLGASSNIGLNMKNLVILLAVIIFSSHAFSKVSNEDLDDIQKLTKDGKYQQALEKHLWFHEESKTSKGMGGVRLSFAIGHWVYLGEKYPPALDALVKIRDINRDILLSGKGNFDNFMETSSINRELDEKNNTYELFLTLDKKYPKQAERYYHVAEALLIEKKEYELCGKYIGDPVFKYEKLRHFRELNLSMARKKPKMNNPEYLKLTDERYIDGVLKLIEVLMAIQKEVEAKEIQKRAMSYFSNDEIKHAI